MRSSGTLYLVQIAFALLLVPSASGSPRAEAASAQLACAAPATPVKAPRPLVSLRTAPGGR